MKNTYNKIEPEPVRIGNWVEESALHDMTGEHRYTSWAPKEDGPSLYATRARKPEKEDTFRRTILHTAYLTPDPGTIPDITHARPVTSPRKGRPAPPVSTSDRPLAIPPEVDPWATTNRTDFADPLVQGRGTWLPETVYGQKDLPRGVGVRAALRQRALQERAMAEACAVAEDPAEELTTTHRETFKEHDLKGMVVGKRRDKDSEGHTLRRDPTFLHETHILPRRMADRVAIAQGDTLPVDVAPSHQLPNPLYNTGLTGEKVPALHYTILDQTLRKTRAECAASGADLSETFRATMSATQAPKPQRVEEPFFGRDSNFTMHVAEFNKRPNQ